MSPIYLPRAIGLPCFPLLFSCMSLKGYDKSFSPQNHSLIDYQNEIFWGMILTIALNLFGSVPFYILNFRVSHHLGNTSSARPYRKRSAPPRGEGDGQYHRSCRRC